jgi:hypothetical protein
MWQLLKIWHVIKERDFSPRHMNNFDEVNDEESQASDQFHCTSAKTDTKKDHLYNVSYLSISFKGTGDSSCHVSLYIIYGKQLTNAAMAAEKLK